MCKEYYFAYFYCHDYDWCYFNVPYTIIIILLLLLLLLLIIIIIIIIMLQLRKLTNQANAISCTLYCFKVSIFLTWTDNTVRELATVCLPWHQWTKTLEWFDDFDISAFHSCVVVDLWQSLSEWHPLLSACVFVCRRKNVGAWIGAKNEH